MPTPLKYTTPEQRRQARAAAARARRGRTFTLDATEAVTAFETYAQIGVATMEQERRLNSTEVALLTEFTARLRLAFTAEMLVKHAPRSNFVA